MRQISSLFALLKAFYILMREGVITALPDEGAPPPLRLAKTIAKVIRRRPANSAAPHQASEVLGNALERLGPSWVKLGQFLATRPDIVGDDIARDLELLQDKMAPFSQQKARQVLQTNLGSTVDELFVEFGEPVAAASIAQVHKALIKDENGTRPVAVKIIRPDIRERFARDLRTFYFAARTINRLFPSLHRLQLVPTVDILAESARLEMDLRLEAAAFSEIAENIKDDQGFRVPHIDWSRSSRDCITMEWIDGIKMNDMEALKASPHDLTVIANNLNQNFLKHAIRDGFFHADMHPGNLFLDKNGTIVAVDLGITGRLNVKERRFMAETLYGFITRDYHRVAELHIEIGYVPANKDVDSFAQALRAVGEPIYGKKADEISIANLLTLLFEITELFDMETQPQLLLLQKTMVVVEGVARKLDPQFDMWASGKPILGPFVSRLVGPLAQVDEAVKGLKALHHMLRQAPIMAQRVEELTQEIEHMAKEGLHLNAPTIAAIGQAEARHSRSGRIALWIIALCAVAWVSQQFI